MNLLKRTLITLMVVCTFFSYSFAATDDENLVQMAILLDTSNSMDGLIDQAKSQLWKIVNELAQAKKGGKSPAFQTALYEYGKDSISPSEGYIRQIVPFTSDLDQISDELFKLTTNGGDEYCGNVIKRAVSELKWTGNNNALKVIFIAGNEAFTQGKVDYASSCKEAISKGIIVNTIFCGDFQEGVNTKWKAGADLADGTYTNIDQNKKSVYIEAPQDQRILELNRELNDTYIGYGSEGSMKKEVQTRQDSNAAASGKASMVERSVAKSASLYTNSSWDLVDAAKTKPDSISKMKDEELPAEMKGMSKDEKVKYVKEKAAKRDKIQAEITKLNQERQKYIDSKIKSSASEETLDSALIKTIKKQAENRGFKKQ